jgi:hypothetical protein
VNFLAILGKIWQFVKAVVRLVDAIVNAIKAFLAVRDAIAAEAREHPAELGDGVV